jgi:hypothetical protein
MSSKLGKTKTMSFTQSTSYATSAANQVSTESFGKSDDKPFGYDVKPNSFNQAVASRNNPGARGPKLTDRQRHEQCRAEGTCFPIVLGEALKDHIRPLNGLIVNHKKNYTMRTGKAKGNSVVLSDVRRYKGFNDLSYALFAMHCATKNLNYELTNDLLRYIVEHFGLTEREVVEARYGINKDNLLGINLFNCAIGSLAVDCFRLALCHGTDPNQVNSYGEDAEGMIRWAEGHLNKHKPESSGMHAVRREQCLDFIREAREFDEIKRLNSLEAQPEVFNASEETMRDLPIASAIVAKPKKAKKAKPVLDVDDDGFSTVATVAKKATKPVPNKKIIGSTSAFGALMADDEDEDDKKARKAAKKAKKLEKAEKEAKKEVKKAKKEAKKADIESDKSDDETSDINFMTPVKSSTRSSSPPPVVRKKKVKKVPEKSMTSSFSALSFESDSDDSDDNESDKSNDETPDIAIASNVMTPDTTTNKSIPDAPKKRRSLKPQGMLIGRNLDKELLSASVTTPIKNVEKSISDDLDSDCDDSELPPLISESEDSDDDFVTPAKKTRVSFADKLKAASNETKSHVARPKTKEPDAKRLTLKHKKKMKKEKAKAELESSTSSEKKSEPDAKSDKSGKIYQNDEEGQQYMDEAIAHIYVLNDEDAALILPYVEQIRLTMDPSLLEEFNELFSTIM